MALGKCDELVVRTDFDLSAPSRVANREGFAKKMQKQTFNLSPHPEEGSESLPPKNEAKVFYAWG